MSVTGGPKLDAKILVLDDQIMNIHVLTGALEHAGYSNITSRTDSRQVPAVFDELQPDLVLTDWHMPHMNGEAVLRYIRSSTATPQVPVIVITADSTPVTRRDAVALGATDFVTKPFVIRALLETVQQVLESGHSAGR